MDTLKPFSAEARTVKPGIYQHCKGKAYEVLYVGRHEESLDEVVIYKALYDERDVWVRSLAKFLETVTMPDGTLAPRFRYLRSA